MDTRTLKICLISFLLVVSGVSCSISMNVSDDRDNPGLVTRAVDDFHNAFNSGQYDHIYMRSDEDFRNAGKETDFLIAMSKLSQRLGKAHQVNQTGRRTGRTSKGTIVTVTYNTEFSNGAATEEFVWIIKDDSIKLGKYSIQSPLFLQND
jgi:hypothetical protein